MRLKKYVLSVLMDVRHVKIMVVAAVVLVDSISSTLLSKFVSLVHTNVMHVRLKLYALHVKEDIS